MGTSMGEMHTWVWGETYPGFMDGLVPLASVPTQIAGRNRVLRRMVLDSIRGDPEWKNGGYQAQPRQGLTAALHILMLMTSSLSSGRRRRRPKIRPTPSWLSRSSAGWPPPTPTTRSTPSTPPGNTIRRRGWRRSRAGAGDQLGGRRIGADGAADAPGQERMLRTDPHQRGDAGPRHPFGREDVFSAGYFCPKGLALKELHGDLRTGCARRW
jgi:homoserine acetyltransferase